MKRRIVRITAGALIVLAWLAAGVYAFWGPKKEGEETPAAIDAQQMSQQIAAANTGKPETLTPVAAIESSPTVVKPTASGLFSPSKVSSAGSFKPRAGTFQPPSAPPSTSPDQPPASVYGLHQREADAALHPDDQGLPAETDLPPVDAPPAEADALAEEADAAGLDVPETPKPLRDVAAGYGAEADPSTETEPAPDQERPLTPPPSRFGTAATNNASPAPRANPSPASTFGGGRFGAPPTNTLPADDADLSAAEAPSTYAAPPARNFGGSRFGNTGDASADEAVSSAIADAPLAKTSVASPRPGERAFEGTQSPALVIEKLAPAEIQVGKPAIFEIHVRNAGQTAAQQVIVTDHVPAGTKFVDAKPEASPGAGGLLIWQLGKLEPGEDKTITLELLPQQEGEIGSVAQVTFAAAASVKTVCTKPMLTVEHIAPAKVMIGETVTLQITISNPGTGAATGVVLQEDVPEGLAHSAGKELEYEVGTLRPGESRKLELQLEAAKAGMVVNRLVVRGDANLEAEHTSRIEVIAPQLAVEMNGPKLRYLDRQATYTVSIANPGTAAARDVEIVAYLPKGMKFVSTDKEGQYDPQNHAVYWSLEELPPA